MPRPLVITVVIDRLEVIFEAIRERVEELEDEVASAGLQEELDRLRELIQDLQQAIRQ